MIKVKVICNNESETRGKIVYRIIEMLLKSSQYSSKRIDKKHFDQIFTRGKDKNCDPEINLKLKIKDKDANNNTQL